MDRLDYLSETVFYRVSEGVVSNQRIIKMFDIVNDEILIKEKEFIRLKNSLLQED